MITKLIGLIFLFLLIIIIGMGVLSTQMENTVKEVRELKILIQERTTKDSLYIEHMRECAFISKKDILIGHQGYLYSKYFRDNIK